MSINPIITHTNPGQPVWAPYGVISGNVPFVNINVQGGDITASYPGGAGQVLFDDAGDVIFAQTAVQGDGNPRINQIVVNGAGVQQSIGQIVTGNTEMVIGFGTGDPAVTQGSITITNNVGGGNGGVAIEGEDGSSLSVGNGAVTVGGGANLVAPTVNGRTLGKVAEWQSAGAAPLVFAGVSNVATDCFTFTNLIAGNWYRVTCVADIVPGTASAAADDITLYISGAANGVQDLITVTWGMSLSDTITGTFSVVFQAQSPLVNPVLTAITSTAPTWNLTIPSGFIENLGTMAAFPTVAPF